MADLGSLSEVGGPQGTPVTPKQTPVDTSKASDINLVSNVIKTTAPTIFSAIDRSNKAEAESEERRVLTQFTKTKIKIADSLAQGTIKPSEAGFQNRALLSATISSNEAYEDSIRKADASLGSSNSFKVLREGTVAQQEELKLYREAVQNGHVDPKNKPYSTEAQLGIQKGLRIKREGANIESEIKSLKLIQEKLATGHAKSNKELLDLERANKLGKARITQSLFTITSEQSVTQRRLISEVFKKLDKNDPSYGTEQALAELHLNNQEFLQVLQATAGMGDEGLLSSVTSQMDNIYNLAVKRISRPDLNEALQNEIDIEGAKALKIGELSEKSKVWLGVGKVLKVLPAEGIRDLSDEVANRLQAGEGGDADPQTPFPTTESGKKNVQGWVDAIGKIVEYRDTPFGSPNSDLSDEVLLEQVEVLLDTIPTSGRNLDPKNMTILANFFADRKAFGELSAKGKLSPDAMFDAQQLYNRRYTNTVMPLVVDRYHEAVNSAVMQTGLLSKKESSRFNVADAIVPVPTTEGMRFEIAPNVDPTIGERELLRVVSELNAEVAPLINQQVRMDAHFGQSFNYKQVYEETFQSYFGIVEDDSAQAEPSPTPEVEIATMPTVGEVRRGYEYLGGDPNSKSNWRATNG